MEIRAEVAADHDAVRDMHVSAFGDHGGRVADLVASLRPLVKSGHGLSLVAADADQVFGHVMFTRCWLDATRQLVEVRVLSPLGVVPEHQRRGAGSALVRSGLTTLVEERVPLVMLEGDPVTTPALGS